MTEKALVIGNTYFSLMYADRHLLIPEIQTLVYLGRSQTDAGIPIHLFQHGWSYHNDGNWEKMYPERKQQFDEVPLFFFEVGNFDFKQCNLLTFPSSGTR